MKLEYFQGSFFTAREEFSKSKKIPQVMYFSAKAVALYVCQSLESLCAVVINVAGACFFKQCKLKDAIAPSFVFIGTTLFSASILSCHTCWTVDKIFYQIFDTKLNSCLGFSDSSWFSYCGKKVNTCILDEVARPEIKCFISTLFALPLTTVLFVDIISSPFIDLGKACLELGGMIIRPSSHSFYDVKVLIVSAVARVFLVPFNLISLPVFLVIKPLELSIDYLKQKLDATSKTDKYLKPEYRAAQ